MGRVLSPEGKTKPFDSGADWYMNWNNHFRTDLIYINRFGGGEAVCVIVLELFNDALRENGHIYSVVRSNLGNNPTNLSLTSRFVDPGIGDQFQGSQMPLNVPSAVVQKDCIETAFTCAGRKIDAEGVKFHILGTARGDPIEANAAGEIFPPGTVVGSIKGNIGYLKAAAFLALLLKTCLILEK
ncbi:hypothetical protein C8J57DRAFT_1250010 [Mycena rebaudengoi]|nr:hypothetical protein C8J57DRAFT_1250010 [Mycena rebaudengoi]